jgi:hypothetical protein
MASRSLSSYQYVMRFLPPSRRRLSELAVAIAMFIVGVASDHVNHRPQRQGANHPISGIAVSLPPKSFPSCEPFEYLEDHLSFKNFELLKRHKKVRIDFSNRPIDVSFAQLRQDGKIVMSFDGLYHPMGNETQFGLFNLLGNEKSQLVVEQAVWKGGRHWIIDLSDDHARTIFDSHDWGAGREDFCQFDLDGDGQVEVAKPITDFYGLAKFPMSMKPLPFIVFRYDSKAKRYIPANDQFRSYSLSDLPTQIGSANAEDWYAQSAVVSVLLDYVFAGQREKGWAHFEKNYQSEDKSEMREEIQGILNRQPVYQFLYRSKVSSKRS